LGFFSLNVFAAQGSPSKIIQQVEAGKGSCKVINFYHLGNKPLKEYCCELCFDHGGFDGCIDSDEGQCSDGTVVTVCDC
jgi:hypothetical protein